MSFNLGMGVMLGMLAGNRETVDTLTAAIGKCISAAAMENDVLKLRFDDGTGIDVYDDGQSCCEHRYMTTDDALEDFVGATLTGMELAGAPDVNDGSEAHELQFLKVHTSAGTFTMETHNVNNGFYGGFLTVVRPWSPTEES